MIAATAMLGAGTWLGVAAKSGAVDGSQAVSAPATVAAAGPTDPASGFPGQPVLYVPPPLPEFAIIPTASQPAAAPRPPRMISTRPPAAHQSGGQGGQAEPKDTADAKAKDTTKAKVKDTAKDTAEDNDKANDKAKTEDSNTQDQLRKDIEDQIRKDIEDQIRDRFKGQPIQEDASSTTADGATAKDKPE